MSKLPAQGGLVPVAHIFNRRVAAKPFLNPGEQARLNSGIQLPQFHPRTQWPHPPNLIQAGYDNVHINGALRHIDWDEDDELNDLHDLMHAHHADLLQVIYQMPPFQPNNFNAGVAPQYQVHDWWEHVAVCQRLVRFRISSNPPWIEKREMMAFLTIISYGMDHDTAFFRPMHVDMITQDGVEQPAETHKPEFKMLMKSNHALRDEDDVDFIGRAMYGRRWLVAPILYGESLWGMTVFDRLAGQLFVFDCGARYQRDHITELYVETRQNRIKAVVHLWVQFWNFMHMPFTFQYFAPGVTQEQSVGRSGLLSVMWAMHNLRNKVGKYMDPEDDDFLRRDINISQPDLTTVLERSSLPLHDWIPDGCTTEKSGWLATKHTLKVMMLNELGLPQDDITKALRPAGRLSAHAEMQLHIRDIHLNQEMPQNAFWCGQGGWQIAYPNNVGFIPYDANAERFHYDDGRPHVHIENRPRNMVFRPRANHVWHRSVQFTENHPLPQWMPRPALGINPDVHKIRRRREEDQDNAKHFHLYMLNLFAAPHRQEIDKPLKIFLHDAQQHRDNRGHRLLQFRLTCSFGGAAWVTRTVEFSLNQLPFIPGGAVPDSDDDDSDDPYDPGDPDDPDDSQDGDSGSESASSIAPSTDEESSDDSTDSGDNVDRAKLAALPQPPQEASHKVMSKSPRVSPNSTGSEYSGDTNDTNESNGPNASREHQQSLDQDIALDFEPVDPASSTNSGRSSSKRSQKSDGEDAGDDSDDKPLTKRRRR